MGIDKKYIYIPLAEPTLITEQDWPEETFPLVHTRTMTYMHENYIRECIEGILMQKTTFPVKMLIHDDASTDKTIAILREYEQKYPRLIKVFYQKENSYSKPDKHERRGEFMSWRVGKYEATCEGDDYWIDPLKLQKQVEFLEKNEDFAAASSDFKKFIESKDKFEEKSTKAGEYSFSDFVLSNKVGTLTSCFRMDLYKEYIKDINPGSKGWLLGDYPLWLYLSFQKKIKILPDITAVYRILDESASHSKDTTKELLFNKNVQRIKRFFLDYFNSPTELRNRADLISYRDAELSAIRANDTVYCTEILECYKRNGYKGLIFFMKLYMRYPSAQRIVYFVERVLLKLHLIKPIIRE